MNLKTSNNERSMASGKALDIIKSEIESQHHAVEYLQRGSDIKTWQCFLSTPENKQFIGCGKGFGVQSKTSATFEAFEHFVDYTYYLVKPNKFRHFFSYNQIADFDMVDYLNELPRTFTKRIDRNKKLPWLEYQSFDDAKKLYLPLCLTVPYYDEKHRLNGDEVGTEYSAGCANSSGSASGISFTEAAIHAINECIERDATSLFLTKAFIKKEKIKCIMKSTLPDYLQEAISSIEAKYNDNLAIVDISSDFGVPTVCVSFTRQNAAIPPKGFGTSLNKTYAIERALLESLQPLHLRNANLDRVEKNTLNRLSAYPLLAQAAKGDIGQLIGDKQFVAVAYDEMIDPVNDLSLNEQLDALLKAVRQHGYQAYYTVTKVFKSGITCLRIIIPGLDKFYLVQIGKTVLPGKRSYDLLS